MDELKNALTEAVGVLRRLEWSGQDRGADSPHCPLCKGTHPQWTPGGRPGGHSETCPIRKAIERAEKAGQDAELR